MTSFKNHELPPGYQQNEKTGFIQIITSQRPEKTAERSSHFERCLSDVRDDLHSVLENKFCPFVRGIEMRDGYYVYPEFAQVGEERLPALGQAAQRAFLHLAGEAIRDPLQTKFLTTMISFHHPKSQEKAFCRLMDEYRDRARMSFLENGLMLLQIHPYHSQESERGQEGHLYSSKAPLLMVRAMNSRDHVFMNTGEEMAAYGRFFG